MSQTQLRPLGFGEILDGAFTLYRRHFLVLFITTLIPLAPFGLMYARLLAGGAMTDPAAANAMLGMLFLLGLVSMVFIGVVFGALTRQTAQAYTGGRVSIGDGFVSGLRALLPMVVAGILMYIAMFVLFMIVAFGAGIVAGLFGLANSIIGVVIGGLFGLVAAILAIAFLASFFAVLPVIVVERKGPIAALTRSWALARGGRLRIVGVFFVSWLITTLPVLGIMLAIGTAAALVDPTQYAAMTTTQLYLQQAISTLSGSLTLPFTMACLVLLYFDRRIRSEGYDLEVATAALTPSP